MNRQGRPDLATLFVFLATATLLFPGITSSGCGHAQAPEIEASLTPPDTPAEEAAPEEPDETTGTDEQEDGRAVRPYRIEIGDIFDVKIYNNPGIGETLVVRPDGKISLLLAEEIQAAGLTPAELDAVITEIYSKRLLDPEIAIIMREFAGNRVYVGGEVKKPAELLIEGRLTLLQAIYKAGGFSESAKLKSVVLLRDQDREVPEVRLVDVEKILRVGEGDILLYPYDAIFVPKTIIAKVDKFVDQYINKVVPRNLTTSFAWTYDLNPWIEVFSQ
ncbi:polysaccharide biosynthesis/export family protein [Thermodesulfobacteriota bacterium]